MDTATFLQGESESVEFKIALPSQSINYTKTAVAFANGRGGRIIFGVENNTWRVAGIPDDKVFTVMDAISSAIVDSCEPLIVPDIAMQDVDGKTVIVVEILPGAQRPYYIKSLGRDQGTYSGLAARQDSQMSRLSGNSCLREPTGASTRLRVWNSP